MPEICGHAWLVDTDYKAKEESKTPVYVTRGWVAKASTPMLHSCHFDGMAEPCEITGIAIIIIDKIAGYRLTWVVGVSIEGYPGYPLPVPAGVPFKTWNTAEKLFYDASIAIWKDKVAAMK